MNPHHVGRLAGKSCVVAGAGQGIGLEVTRAFLAEGANVLALDLQPGGLPELTEDGLDIHILDVADAAAVTRCAEREPDADVLVNCVGRVAEGTVLECDSEELAAVLRINVGSMANTIRAWLPGMRARQNGSIINIASVASSVSGLPNRFAYGASKAAVIGLTKSVARDFVADGVRCNAISPGTVLSPSLEQRVARSGDPKAAMAAFIARQPMGRLGAPSEIAAVAILLASDEARFMTGDNIVVDGGLSL